MNKIIRTQSDRETLKLAQSFAKTIKAGAVILLEGDLGSGKTTFVKGLASGLGVKRNEPVTSPTFVIMRRYRGKLPIYHFDLYRLESEAELEAIGFEEFLNDPTAISCVEWPEKAGTLLPPEVIRVQFKVTGLNERTITLPSGETHEC